MLRIGMHKVSYMLNKYYLLSLCSTTMMLAMDTPRPAYLYKAFVVVLDYDHVICLNDAKRPGQLHLPGGIIASNQSTMEVVCDHLEEQTGISITTDVLNLIAQSTRFNVHQQRLLDQSYYLVENRRLEPSKEDTDDLYTIDKSIEELAEGKPYLPRDHGKPSLQVGILLQKIAQHIKTGCTQYEKQEFLENIKEPGFKTYLELFPKKKSQ